MRQFTIRFQKIHPGERGMDNAGRTQFLQMSNCKCELFLAFVCATSQEKRPPETLSWRRGSSC